MDSEEREIFQFLIKPVGKKSKDNRWVAPNIAKILEESGVQMDSAGGETAPDEYYEGL
jgi:hypothetical protein